MADRPSEGVERLLTGDLSPEEQRRLAQAALADPDLFDELTAAAAARMALASESLDKPATADTMRTGRRSPGRVAVFAGLAAAAVLVLAVAVPRLVRHKRPAAEPPAASIATPPQRIPQPVLLTATIVSAASTPRFRAPEERARLPKPAGTIQSVQGNTVEVDLGAIDGIEKRSELTVRHASGRTDRVTITTVFRDRSRGQSSGAEAPRVGDSVEAGTGSYVKALVDEASARLAANDEAGARNLLGRAASISVPDAVPADLWRQVLARLGALDRHAGDVAAAARHLTAAAAEFGRSPAAPSAERADVLNELGATQIEQHEYAAAEQTLHTAYEMSAGATRMRIGNNLGAAAALRGDLEAARSWYQQAQAAAEASPDLASDRRAIDTNLNAISASR